VPGFRRNYKAALDVRPKQRQDFSIPDLTDDNLGSGLPALACPAELPHGAPGFQPITQQIQHFTALPGIWHGN
jgi:hypothetical protein